MTDAPPMRVLVVDDSDDAAVTMAFLLKRFGHEAVVARSGESALQQAPLFRPDVMFIDLAMPDVDGFSVARTLRQTKDFAETPLVAVSGYVDDEHRTQATAAGFTEFLPKPYPLTVLQATLERIANKVSASRIKVQSSRDVLSQTLERIDHSQSKLGDYWRTREPPIPVSVEKSGGSNVLALSNRLAAEELRRWLKNQRCRVGPVFEPTAGQFTFFVYTRRHLTGDLIGKHGGFQVMH